ncbi:hybrid sensor histidine kinase/response regulator [Chitinimonas taiwanensis]|uniref:Chemotaxis protein CheA n=1 Tax=Chitinimonas taiwanensis DSM 18899 TaxID=1121279 RepID=A0A1K2HT83_9NEIS|nr:response regulator [Chitinimonas taiwanensis]SFZ79482.1 two-component system, chemotaxis family, sensor kinase CheA [Chitinimonas taiwanensis DSM 18899]
MPLDRQALMQRLLASFQEEAAERLAVLDSELPTWQRGAPTPASVETVFREVHSLKGAARAVGLLEIEQICHAWEACLLALRQGEATFRPEQAAQFLQTLQLLKRAHGGDTLPPEQVKQACAALTLAAATPPTASQAPPATPATQRPTARPRGQTVRVRAEQFEQFAYHSEALRQARLQMAELNRRSQRLQADFQRLWQRRLRHEGLLGRLRQQLDAGQTADPAALRQLLDWQDWSQDLLNEMHGQSQTLRQSSGQLNHELGNLSEAHTRSVDALLQLPCRSLLDELPALVSDLAAQTGKQASLSLPDTELRVDKRVLDALRTPLLHLLRNAIDHGIEMPLERRQAGKPAEGRLSIELSQHSASHFTLLLEDDGAGIDTARVQARAEQSGLLPAQDGPLPSAQLLPLIFAAGLSTRQSASVLSGRGEGLAIVRAALEQLGGDIDVASTPGQGCRFILHLPLNRSSFRVVLVQVGEHRFAVPANAVRRNLRLPASALQQREGDSTLQFDGLYLPVRQLAEVLAVDAPPPSGTQRQLFLLGEGMQQIAVEVDQLLGDQEITLRALGKPLRRLRNLLGATVLGDGSVVPVLHPQDLYRSCLQRRANGQPTAVARAPSARRQARILVVDDSFTARGLLRALLETAGYAVQTANDGLEAWNALRQGQFDLLVSDIEMPRLDGFALTEKLRRDPALAALPVVLITALHRDEDRARGLEVGANAYLVKGGLETDTVLSAVQRLL